MVIGPVELIPLYSGAEVVDEAEEIDELSAVVIEILVWLRN